MTAFYQQVASTGFSTWVRESGSLWSFPGILLLHTYGMGILVGLILVIDLRVLGFAPALPLAPLQRLLPLVWIAFGLNAVTGVILLAADAPNKMTNPDFGVKMGFIVLAVIVQLILQKQMFGHPSTELPRSTSMGRMLAIASLVCWLGAITAGRLLAYVGPDAGLTGLK